MYENDTGDVNRLHEHKKMSDAFKMPVSELKNDILNAPSASVSLQEMKSEDSYGTDDDVFGRGHMSLASLSSALPQNTSVQQNVPCAVRCPPSGMCNLQEREGIAISMLPHHIIQDRTGRSVSMLPQQPYHIPSPISVYHDHYVEPLYYQHQTPTGPGAGYMQYQLAGGYLAGGMRAGGNFFPVEHTVNNDRQDRREFGRRDRDYDRRDRHSYSSGYGMGGNAMMTGNNPSRDPLVEDFRLTFGKSRIWTLRDISGHVVAFCQDQHGSRFIQQRLEVCSDEEKQMLLDELLPVANPLTTDVFGNYVLQKILEYGSPIQVDALATMLMGQASSLSMQMYGCRILQKALEYCSTQRLLALVVEFEAPPVLLRCVHDSNANHVIQKIIETVSCRAKHADSRELSDYLSSRLTYIMDVFRGRCKELSMHPYGCRVIQRILEHCTVTQKSDILEELRCDFPALVQDCYGNYVIQYVMQHGFEADRSVLVQEIKEHLVEYSQHKFASNVVEKCLQYASRRDRDEMVWSIINYTFDATNPVDNKGHCVLESMVRDPYANYVVQKVIDVSDERQRAAILRYVRENIAQLRRYTYGKHIIVRLEKLTNEKF